MNNRIYYSEEAEQLAKRQQALAVILFTTVGLTIGAVLALLLAPKSGDQIRRELSSTLNEGADASSDAFKRLEKDFGELRKQVEERIRS